MQINKYGCFLFLLWIPLMWTGLTFAQDSVRTDLTQIQILQSDSIIFEKVNEEDVHRLIGNVVLQHEDMRMICDSAKRFLSQNVVEAFGNVEIYKGGTSSAKANYMKYAGNTGQTTMRNNVQLYDEGNTLVTDHLDYNVHSKVGIYTQGGYLNTNTTTVSSGYGRYNGRTKDAYFKENVMVNSKDADIESREMTYNTETKQIVFLDETFIYGDKATIQTKKGKYNENTGQADFTGFTTVENEEQIISALRMNYNEKSGIGNASGKVVIYDKQNNTILKTDKVDYDKTKGRGIALGHVHYTDTTNKIELYAGRADYNEFSKFLLATNNPLLITLADGDSLFIISDTMISVRSIDVMRIKDRKRQGKEYTYSLLLTEKDSITDFDDQKIIIAHQNVQMFSDSLQAVADSLTYSQVDSTFRLYKKPVLWNADQQAEADTIYLYTTDHQLNRAELRTNSFLVSSTGFQGLYNQLKGRDMDVFFDSNRVHKIYVEGQANSHYYAQDEEEKFVGANQAEGEVIVIYFENKELSRIVFKEEPHGVFYPMEKLSDLNKFLEGFLWKEDKRPKDKSLFDRRRLK